MVDKTVEIHVDGLVQGVGFRYYTTKAACRLDITGWVANQSDGSVKIIASGKDPQLNQFIQIIKDDPAPLGRVTHFSSNYIPFQSFNEFGVKY